MIKKIITFILTLAFAVPLTAGEEGFGIVSKNGEVKKELRVIKAGDVKKIVFTLHVDPSLIKRFDLIILTIARPGIMAGSISFEARKIDQMPDYKKNDKGYKVLSYSVVDYSRESDGRGEFYNSKHRLYMNGNIILSRQGSSDEKAKAVYSYTLSARISGKKILRYRQEFIRGVEKISPVYGLHKNIVKPVYVKIITSEKIEAADLKLPK